MKYVFLLAVQLLTVVTISFAQSNDITLKAQQFLNSLTEKQLVIALHPAGDTELFVWHFVPWQNRKGIPLYDLSPDQKKKGLELIQSSLSKDGYQKSLQIIQLEYVLRVLEKRQKGDWMRDTGNYRFLFFGTPSTKDPWSWRIEGHHLSYTFAFRDNKWISGTPGFMGSNPASFTDDKGQHRQVFVDEEKLAFELVGSMKGEQLSTAVINTTVPGEIITGNSRKAMINNSQGITYAAMDKSQQQLFIQLLRTYINRYTHLLSDQMMQEIADAGLNNLKFVWIGVQKKEPGQPHYYRIQGPTIIIEYDNTQNNANHVHTVVRDLKNDFGGDMLLEHYKKEH
ncbi:MAG: DUF3500 domain-containing protein [Chitinophagaceae bacterium]